MSEFIIKDAKNNDVNVSVERFKFVNFVNRIPCAYLVLNEDSNIFDVGSHITLQKDPLTEFKGVVSEKSKSFNGGVFTYEVKLVHPVYQLTKHRKTRVFEEGVESKLLESIINLYPDLKLTFEYKNASEDKVEQLIQYDCTDWDFILSRAEANGCVVAVEGNEIRLINKSAILTGQASKLINNTEIQSVSLKSYHQQASDAVSLSFHNSDNLKAPLTESVKTNDIGIKVTQEPKPEESTMFKYPGVFGEAHEAKSWSTGKALRNLLARIQGKIELVNLHFSKLLTPVSLAGYEDMNGHSFITGIEINFQNEKVATVLTIGLSEIEFMDLYRIHSPPAGNLLPAIQGLQIGYVAGVAGIPEDRKFKDDTDRIKVIIPSLNADKQPEDKSVWARLTFMAAGHNRGVFFTPEEGDEVLVGFLNNDPRHPYILGCLYSHKIENEKKKIVENKKPFAIKLKDNKKSGIVTKSGLAMEFDDSESGFIELYSPGKDENGKEKTAERVSFKIGKKEVEKDKVGYITIENGSANSISLTKDEMSIGHKKDGDIEIVLNGDGVTLWNGTTLIDLGKDYIEFYAGNGYMRLDKTGLNVK